MSRPRDWHKYDLLATCQAIHGEARGSSSGELSPDELRDRVRWLKMRLQGWEKCWCAYDVAVKALVRETLREWHEWNIERCLAKVRSAAISPELAKELAEEGAELRRQYRKRVRAMRGRARE